MELETFISSESSKLHSWAISLNVNEVQLISTVITAAITLLAAVIAVRTAFKQIAKQFEHKVIYEGWTDFQDKLFEFSTALSNYDSTIQWLSYFIKSQNNPLVNGGDLTQHRTAKWNSVVNEYGELQKRYISLLRSYEGHEIIFTSLKKMHDSFVKEYRERVDDKHLPLMERVFPEMYGATNNLSDKQIEDYLNDYWTKSSEISAFLDDFRRELQNVTVGKILNKRIHKRVPPDDKFGILTLNGFVFKKSWFNSLKRK